MLVIVGLVATLGPSIENRVAGEPCRPRLSPDKSNSLIP